MPPGGSPGAVSRRERLSRRARARRPRRADDDGRSRCGSRRAASTLVTCPRSNGHTGAGAPPIEDFYASGVQRRGRHRQPRQRAGPERLRRAGDDARAGAVGAGRRAARQRDAPGRPRARLRRRLRHDRARQARAPAGRRDSGADATMWKNTWSAGSSRTRSRLDCRDPMQIGDQIDLQSACKPSNRNLKCSSVFASTCRSSASATRCSRCRLRWPARCWRRSEQAPVDAGRTRRAGFSWRWWRRAARRWDSTASWTRASTR